LAAKSRSKSNASIPLLRNATSEAPVSEGNRHFKAGVRKLALVALRESSTNMTPAIRLQEQVADGCIFV
jgi:hypothetical protein